MFLSVTRVDNVVLYIYKELIRNTGVRGLLRKPLLHQITST